MSFFSFFCFRFFSLYLFLLFSACSRIDATEQNTIPYERDKQLAIPADGRCMYSSLCLAYLLPKVDQVDRFNARVNQLFGEKIHLTLTPEELLEKVSDISYLKCERFVGLIKLFMDTYQFDHKIWGGNKEMQTIANDLQVAICEYTCDPENEKKLIPMLIKPQGKYSDTIHIIRDHAWDSELIDQLPLSREGDPQHFRVLIPEVFLKKMNKYNPFGLLSEVNISPIISSYKGEKNEEKDDDEKESWQDDKQPTSEPPSFTLNDLKEQVIHTYNACNGEESSLFSEEEEDDQGYQDKLFKQFRDVQDVIMSQKTHIEEPTFSCESSSYKHQEMLPIARYLNLVHVHMPDCFLKSIKELAAFIEAMYMTQMIKNKTEDQLKETPFVEAIEPIVICNGQKSIPFLVTQSVILKCLSQIRKKLDTYPGAKKMEKEIEELYKQVDIAAFQSAWKTIKGLQKKLEPVDVDLTQYYIDEAKKTAKGIKGETAIIFIGFTRVGKSTSIHYLCGSKIKRVEYTSGLEHYECTNTTKNNSLEKVSCTPFCISETRFITRVPIHLKDMGIRAGRDRVTLCDTPGLGDTNGAPVDISNSIGVTEALRSCKNVIPVIVIPYYHLKGTAATFKVVADTLIEMLPSFEQFQESFFYLFTHVDKDVTLHNIHGKIKNIKENLDGEYAKNKPLLALLEDIEEQTIVFSKDKNTKRDQCNESDSESSEEEEPKIQRAWILRPTKKKERKKMLTDMASLDPIGHPKEHFQPYLSRESKEAVTKQIYMFQDWKELALSHNNIGVLIYILKKLKQLSEIIPTNSDIENAYKEIAASITKQRNDVMAQKQEKLSDAFAHHPTLNKELIEEYQSVYSFAQQCDQLCEKYLPDLMPSRTMFAELKNMLIKATLFSKKCALSEKKRIEILGKAKVLIEYFPTLESLYKEIIKNLVNDLLKKKEEIKSHISQKTIDQALPVLLEVKKGFDVGLQSYIAKEQLDIKAFYFECLDIVCSTLPEKLVKLLEQTLPSYTTESEEIGEETQQEDSSPLLIDVLLKETIQKIAHEINELSNLCKKVNEYVLQEPLLRQCQTTYKESLKSIASYMIKCQTCIDICLQEKEYEKIASYNDCINQLLEISDVRNQLQNPHRHQRLLKEHVNNVKKSIAKSLQNISLEEEEGSFFLLSENISFLMKTTLIDSSTRKIYTGIVEKSLELRIKRVKEKDVWRFRFGLDNPNDFKEGIVILEQLIQLSKVACFFEKPKKIVNNIIKSWYNTMSSVYSEIKKSYQLDQCKKKWWQDLLDGLCKYEKAQKLEDELQLMYQEKHVTSKEEVQKKLLLHQEELDQWKKNKQQLLDKEIKQLNSDIRSHEKKEKNLFEFLLKINGIESDQSNSWNFFGQNKKNVIKNQLEQAKCNSIDQLKNKIKEKRLTIEKLKQQIQNSEQIYQTKCLNLEEKAKKWEKINQEVFLKAKKIADLKASSKNILHTSCQLSEEAIQGYILSLDRNKERCDHMIRNTLGNYCMQPLDINQAMKHLDYLQSSETMATKFPQEEEVAPEGLLRDMHSDAQKSIHYYLGEYATNVNKELDTALACINPRHYNHKLPDLKEIKKLETCVLKIVDKLDENNIVNNRVPLKSMIKNSLVAYFKAETMKNRLHDLRQIYEQIKIVKINLSNDKRSELNSLKQCMNFLRVLAPLDKFTPEQAKFSSLMSEVSLNLYNNKIAEALQIADQLKTFKVEEVKQKVLTMKNYIEKEGQDSKQQYEMMLKQIFVFIEQFLKSIINTVRQQRTFNKMDQKVLEEIKEKLDYLQKFIDQGFFSEQKQEKEHSSLLSLSQCIQLNKHNKKLAQEVVDWLENTISGVDKHIKNLRIKRACNSILMLYHADTVLIKTDLLECLKKITEKFETKLNQELTFYEKEVLYDDKNKKINNPYAKKRLRCLYQEIHEMAEESNTTINIDFSIYKEKIKLAIEDKLSKLMEHLKVNYNLGKNNITELAFKIRSIQKSLPDEIQNDFADSFKETLCIIQYKVNELTQKTKDLLQKKGHYSEKHSHINQLIYSGDQHQVQQIKKSLEEELVTLDDSINKHMLSNDWASLMTHLNSVEGMKSSFMKEKEIREKCDRIERKVSLKIKNIEHSIGKMFSFDPTKEIPHLEELQQGLIGIDSLLQIAEQSNKGISPSIIPKDLPTQLSGHYQGVFKMVEGLKTQVDRSINSLDARKLNQLLQLFE